MNIFDATQSYEAWLRLLGPIHEPDLRYKHQQMSLAGNAFPFFRGTYYRWLQHWPRVCKAYLDGPQVLAVGDVHIENFGTWRDAEGRLVWGINDFDETAEMPYTNDLIRLATSVRLARQQGVVQLGFRKACRAIMRGYQQTLEQGGRPFVLEERNRPLRRLATAAERAPIAFWKKFMAILRESAPVEPPDDVRHAFAATWPTLDLKQHYRYRERVGVGSLGKPRYLALAKWKGSWMAREAKTLTAPANAWVTGRSMPTRIHELLERAVRCHDPFYLAREKWIIRRLAARCSRIELGQLRDLDDEVAIFKAMGAETANMHHATPEAVTDILRDLQQRSKTWLADAARQMCKAVKNDWKDWRKQRH